MANETANADVHKSVNPEDLELGMVFPVPDEKGKIIEELMKQNGGKVLHLKSAIEAMRAEREDKYITLILEAGEKPKTNETQKGDR